MLQAASLILHVGDLTSRSALSALERIGPVRAVHGNMDEPELREKLPARCIVAAEGLRIGLVHDAGPVAGRYDRLHEWFPGCEVIAYGHTHLAEVTRSGAAWIVNPGSPTERRRAPSRSLAVLRDGTPQLVLLD